MNELTSYIFNKLESGITKKKAAFKFGSLASTFNNMPEQRMVVIRKIIDNKIYIYTDNRSQKITHFKNNKNASLLFYDTELMEQLILKGTIKIEESNVNEIWETVPDFAHRDYTTVNAPGTPLKKDSLEYSKDINNFCYLIFEFNVMDYLKINKPNNQRTLITLNNNEWSTINVTP